MPQESTLEIAIASKDERVVGEVEQALAGVNPQRWKDTRDLVTIIAVTAGIAKLITALLELKQQWAKKKSEGPPPQIVINNINRTTIVLSEATEEGLKKLLAEAED